MQTSSIHDQVIRLRKQRAALARQDCSTFIEYVIKDESSGASVRQAPMHEEWHRLAAQHDRLVIMAHVEAAKTNQLSIGRVLWLLGRNPALRCAIISSTFQQATKITRTLQSYVESSAELHEVFPHLVPGKPWSENMLTVVRTTLAKDASIQSWGVHGNILGSRLDLILLDDIVDYESSRTVDARNDLQRWVDSSVLGRVSEDGQIICIATAFHAQDVNHTFESRGWPTYRYPVQDETGAPRWPERWSLSRIAKKREELGIFEAGRQLDVTVLNDETAHFKREWLDDVLAAGAKGTALSWSDAGEPALLHVPEGGRVVVGCDPAVSKKDSADLAALAAVLVHPDKTRELLTVEAGHWSGPEIISRIGGMYRRFSADMVVVETVAAQAYLAQWLRALGSIRVEGYTTGKGKLSLEYRAEQLGTELARRQWRFPSKDGRPRDKEIGLLVKDLAYYTPSAHCPDRVSALCMAQYGCEIGEQRVESFFLNLHQR